MTPFPPTCWQDIFAYDDDEVLAGYRDWRPCELEPGPNHSPGYRWGWANRKRDHTGEDDGMVGVRMAYIRQFPTLLPVLN